MINSNVRTTREQRKTAGRQDPADALRVRLLRGVPVAERRLEAAGIPTAVLVGGDGPPVVLLHGPGEHATKWVRVIPDLVTTHRVVAPDLPGHGASEATDGGLDADRVLAWLGDVIRQTCRRPPALVGQILGGAVAARFASDRGGRLDRLVLADSLGLAPFQPAPEFGQALEEFVTRPSGETHDRLWQRCAFDLDALRDGMGERWEALRAYNLNRARAPGLHAAQRELMERFGMPAIPPESLERIPVPTTLIWGRNDLATPLRVAEAASARYGWPLHVIEDAADDPPLERPAAFLEVLRPVLGGSGSEG